MTGLDMGKCSRCGTEMEYQGEKNNYGGYLVKSGEKFCVSCWPPLIAMINRHHKEELDYINGGELESC